MNILYGVLIFIHVVVSILLVVTVLMQRAKGGGLAGIAGGAASQAMFGGRGAATIIHKATIVLAVVFGLNLLFIGVLSKNISRPSSVTQEALQEEMNELQSYFSGSELPAEGSGTEAVEGGDVPPAPVPQPEGE